MKKYFSISLVFMAFFLAKPVSADVIPEDMESKTICVKFENLSDFSDYHFVTVSVLPNKDVETSLIVQDECVEGFFKLADNRVYGIEKEEGEVLDVDSISGFADDRLIATSQMKYVPAKLVDAPSDVKSYEEVYTIEDAADDQIKLYKSMDKTHYEDGSEHIQQYDASGKMMNEVMPKSVFNDVTNATLYGKAILYLKDKGYIDGYPDGSFKPLQEVNRVELTKMMMNAIKGVDFSKDCVTKNLTAADKYVYFADVAKNQWYSDYVCAAKMDNAIKGYPDGLFKPTLTVNLAEAYKIALTVKYGAGKFDETTGQNWYDTYLNYAYDKSLAITKEMDPSKKINRGEMAEILYLLQTTQ